ncbi:MAG: hypothetical protein H6R14_2357 [Proteobacteria bacterium]|nr:hypothetical protein [Pseudomonadota bacterium]
MNIVNQLEGNRIAKEVTAQAEALALIRARPTNFSQWHYVLAIVAGGCIGALNAYAGEYAQLFMGMSAGIGFFVGVVAFQECLKLRRRFDAAIVLLLKNASRD